MKKEVTKITETRIAKLELKVDELSKRLSIIESFLVGKGCEDDDNEYLIDSIVD